MKKEYTDLLQSTIKNPPKEAKYQLVKERNHIDGTTYYWTCDHTGALVSNTMTTKLGEAQRIFQIVCDNNGKTLTKTILETYYEA